MAVTNDLVSKSAIEVAVEEVEAHIGIPALRVVL